MPTLRDRLLELAHASKAYARERPATVALMAAAFLARLAFWLVTDRVWEDSLITVTHARNAAQGLGLVHHLGEGRVHGFTSAVSVLIPLAGELVVRDGGILALRLASLAASVVAIGFAQAIAERLELRRGPVLFALAYLAFERNQVFYGMAGMETQVAVAVLLGSVLALLDRRERAGGAMLGLALLTRPDFVLWVAPAIGAVAVEDRKRAAKTLGWATLVVAPWLAFTTLYYGSPVPHTILAKAAISPGVPTFGAADASAWASWLGGRWALHASDWAGFAPFLSDGFIADAPVSWRWLALVAFVFLALGATGLVATARRPWAWRAASAYVVVFSLYRFALLPVVYSEWYFPPFMALFALEAAAGLSWLAARWKATLAVDVCGATLAVLFAAPLPFVVGVERRIEHEIEAQVRRPLGLWLKENVPPGESVGCEPAGYIGYYSGVRLYEWPGLTSPTVRRALAKLPREDRTLTRTIVELEPDWIVLRPKELADLLREQPRTASHYRFVRTFAVSDDLLKVGWGGLVKDDFDVRYHVLKRRAPER